MWDRWHSADLWEPDRIGVHPGDDTELKFMLRGVAGLAICAALFLMVASGYPF
jgi:hypothetical protein